MNEYDWYIGTVPIDKIHTLQPPNTPFGFIFNTDQSTGTGEHWVAVWMDPINDKTIEYYDSFAREPTEQFQEQISKIIPDLPYYLKFKVNKITTQLATSDSCGWLAMLFLLNRHKGLEWTFCTGYTDLQEDEVKKIKKKYGYL